MQKILITGARAPIALELARSFAEQGVEVIMADSLRLTVSRWSNSVKKYYLLPAPRYDLSNFILKIQQIIQEEGIAHFIPTCEEAIYVAMHKDKFNCKVWTSEGNLIVDLHNKYRFNQLFKAFLPMPETVLVNEFSNWNKSKEYVFKPIYSRFATAVIIGKQLSKDRFTQLDKHYWIAQKRINGKEICIYSIWDNGILKGYSAYHPLYRAGKGAGIFFKPVTNHSIFNLVKMFGEEINYTGHLCFDVIVDKENNPFFIECNPRGTSGAHLIHKEIAACFIGDTTEIVNQTHAFSIKYGMAMMYPFSFFKKEVIDSKDVIYRGNDKKPFFLQFLSLFEITFLKFKNGKTWLETTTSDIEWNGE